MAVPPVVYKYIAILAVIAGMVFSFFGWKKAIEIKHFKLGVAHCEEAQRKANDLVDPVVGALNIDKKKAETEYDGTTSRIQSNIQVGITEIENENDKRAALRRGKQQGRQEAIREYELKGGCLTVPYPSDSRLFYTAKSLQSEIFGSSVGSNGTPEAGDVLDNSPSPVVSRSPGGEYPQPSGGRRPR